MERSLAKTILFLSLLGGLMLCALRGCLLARKGGSVGLDPALSALSLSVYDHREGVKKELPLEEYLVHVVAGEMPASFHPEALKAQAVAARTYTLYKKDRGGCQKQGADICTDSSCCQAYLSDDRMGERWGADEKENLACITRAVEDTAGEVLLYEGKLIEALYHSASGGQTANAEDVFSNARPYLVSVMSTNESGISDLSREIRFTCDDFIALAEAAYPKAGLSAKGLSEQLAILKTSPDGRVQSFRLGGETLTGKQARSLFGLGTTLFTLSVSRDNVTFFARGSGHGVGLSQTGANGMGLGGAGYREILSYYYRGVQFGNAADLF